jgi:hypothetical protein
MLFEIGKPIDFLGNELPMSAETPAGYIVNAKIKKQKSAPNDRKMGSYYLLCQSGIRVDMDFAQLAINKYGISHYRDLVMKYCKVKREAVDTIPQSLKFSPIAKPRTKDTERAQKWLSKK